MRHPALFILFLLFAGFMFSGCVAEEDSSTPESRTAKLQDVVPGTCPEGCPPGEICMGGVCVPDLVPECQTDADCGPTEVCAGGICTPSDVFPPGGCQQDSDCPPGQLCLDGVCYTPTGGPECADDSDCEVGELCDDGVCGDDPYGIESCQVIGSSGEYYLSAHLSGQPHSFWTGTACVKITAPDVLLDCGIYRINGTDKQGQTYGIAVDNVDNVTIRNCGNLTNYRYGITLLNSSSSHVLNNTPNGQLSYDIYVYGGSGNDVSGNEVSGASSGIHLEESSGNTVSDNDAHDNSYGILVGDNAESNTVTGNEAHLNSWYGIYLLRSSGNTVADNDAHSQKVAGSNKGIYVANATGNNISHNTVYNNSDGIHLLSGSTGNTIYGNMVRDNAIIGIRLEDSDGNDILANTVQDNTNDGLSAQGSSDLLISGNDVHGGGYRGMVIAHGTSNTVTGNEVHDNSGTGIRLINESGDSCTLNEVHDNNGGISCSYCDDVLLEDNEAYDNAGNGFFVDGNPTGNVTLEGNEAYGNSMNGFRFATTTPDPDLRMIGNLVHGNDQAGVSILNTNGVSLDGDHLYGNSPDFHVEGSYINVSMAHVIFDSPSGDLTDYTNLSLNDNVMLGYNISHDTQPAAFPDHVYSFEDKFVDISGYVIPIPNGDVMQVEMPLVLVTVIDEVIWHWSDDESADYHEPQFELWRYSSTWADTGAALDTDANTLTLQGFQPSSTYAIVQNQRCPAPINASGSYSLAGHVYGAPNAVSSWAGVCVLIEASDVAFDCQGYNVTNDGTIGLTGGMLALGDYDNITIENCPSVTGYQYGIGLDGVDGSVIRDSTAHDNRDAGIWVARAGDNNLIVNNTAFGHDGGGQYANDGFYMFSGSGNVFLDNVAYDNTFGFDLRSGASLTNLSGNTAYGNQHGFVSQNNNNVNRYEDNTAYGNGDGFSLSGSGNEILTGNNASGNSGNGFNLQGAGSSANTLSGNTAGLNGDAGFYVHSGAGANALTGNEAFDNGADGFLLLGSEGNNVTGNGAHGNTGSGFLARSGSEGNLLQGNDAYSNGLSGFSLFNTSDCILLDNEAYDNVHEGIELNLSGNNSLSGNDAYSNGMRGIHLIFSDANNVSENLVHGNALSGLVLSSSEWNTVEGNEAYGNGDVGIRLLGSDLNDVLGNDAYDNGKAGIRLVDSDDNDVIGNTAYGNLNGLRTSDGASGNSFMGNTAHSNTRRGFFIGSGQNHLGENEAFGNPVGFGLTSGTNTLEANHAYDNTEHGFSLNMSSGNLFTDNVAYGNNVSGFHLENSSANSFLRDLSYGNPDGFLLIYSDGNSFTDVNSSDNTDDGFDASHADDTMVDPSVFCGNADVGVSFLHSDNVTILDSLICGNADDGLFLSNTDGGLIRNNTVYDNLNGIFLASSSDVLVDDNDVYECNNNGIELSTSQGNLVHGNMVYGNTFRGIELSTALSVGNLVWDNVLFANLIGIDVGGSDNDLADNEAFGNDVGIEVAGAHGISLSGNEVHDNDEGLSVLSSNCSLLLDHFYGNGVDLKASGSGEVLELTTVFFDSPGGNFTNYTNLSLHDVMYGGAYTIDWSADPGIGKPTLATKPFEGKFLNFTNTGAPIDSIVWHWTENESASYVEGRLWLFRVGNVGWDIVNFTPNVDNNTLSASDQNHTGVYGIYETMENADEDILSMLLKLDFEAGCDANILTVTDELGPVSGASVLVIDSDSLLPLATGSTNSTGHFDFLGCGIDARMSVSKSGYLPSSITRSLESCDVCKLECNFDEDCQDDERCVAGLCLDVPCDCGQIQNHRCDKYECCSDGDCRRGEECRSHQCVRADEGDEGCDSDSDCSASQFCDGGDCREVTGLCGYAEDHAWFQYECGTGEGCPACAEHEACVDHACVGAKLLCPDSALVGSTESCSAAVEEEPCVDCDYVITDPAGREFKGKTGENGSIVLPLQMEGTHSVAIMSEGEVVAEVDVDALPKAGSVEAAKPTIFEDVSGTVPYLLLLLAVVILVFYLRGRGKGAKPARKR